MKKIVAATRNEHKIREIEIITRRFGMEIISRDDAGVPKVEIPEDGDSFEENSYIKARAIMEMCGQITIADDSGLIVDCIDGAPGIYSARFADFKGIWPEQGEKDSRNDSTDADNNSKLIKLIEQVPYEERTARFVSVITMLYPDGRKIVARGQVEGRLLLEERGGGGFGYDPLFVPMGYDRTFGELSAEVKNSISHRANALKALHEKLSEFENTTGHKME